MGFALKPNKRVVSDIGFTLPRCVRSFETRHTATSFTASVPRPGHSHQGVHRNAPEPRPYPDAAVEHNGQIPRRSGGHPTGNTRQPTRTCGPEVGRAVRRLLQVVEQRRQPGPSQQTEEGQLLKERSETHVSLKYSLSVFRSDQWPRFVMGLSRRTWRNWNLPLKWRSF